MVNLDRREKRITNNWQDRIYAHVNTTLALTYWKRKGEFLAHHAMNWPVLGNT